MSNCCMDCDERVVGCHSKCGRYKAYIAENKKKKENIRSSDPAREFLVDGYIKRAKKAKRLTAKLDRRYRGA